MSTTAEIIFAQICERPSMTGTPAEVEAALWACMAIWSSENLPPGENHVHTVVEMIRKTLPGLHDKAGLSFHDLKNHSRDYRPVVTHMTSAFNLLKTHVEGPEAERRVRRFAAFIEEANESTAKRLKQVFSETICPNCWGKRPNILDATLRGTSCYCLRRPVP